MEFQSFTIRNADLLEFLETQLDLILLVNRSVEPKGMEIQEKTNLECRYQHFMMGITWIIAKYDISFFFFNSCHP